MVVARSTSLGWPQPSTNIRVFTRRSQVWPIVLILILSLLSQGHSSFICFSRTFYNLCLVAYIYNIFGSRIGDATILVWKSHMILSISLLIYLFFCWFHYYYFFVFGKTKRHEWNKPDAALEWFGAERKAIQTSSRNCLLGGTDKAEERLNNAPWTEWALSWNNVAHGKAVKGSLDLGGWNAKFSKESIWCFVCCLDGGDGGVEIVEKSLHWWREESVIVTDGRL